METVASFPAPNCIGYFSHGSDEISKRSNLQKEGFVSAHGSRGWRVPGGGAW